jgi:hypothetical protein
LLDLIDYVSKMATGRRDTPHDVAEAAMMPIACSDAPSITNAIAATTIRRRWVIP